MIRQEFTLDGETCTIFTCENQADANEAYWWTADTHVLGLDTEATGLDPYERDWELRLFQIGNRYVSYNIPHWFQTEIDLIVSEEHFWIMHNAPHDTACVDRYLGRETNLLEYTVDTKIMSHLKDSRGRKDGGTGHGLKDLSDHYIDKAASEAFKDLKRAFGEIQIPIPGEVYKSGAKKGLPKTRRATLHEGWALINILDPRYTLYSGLDPILTYRIWDILRHFKVDPELFSFEHELQEATFEMQRRGLPVDVDYTKRLAEDYAREIANGKFTLLNDFGLENPNAPQQVVAALQRHGGKLTKKTKKGNLSADKDVLKALSKEAGYLGRLAREITSVKQMSKRKKSYVDTILRKLDENNRVHASINTLAARTARMSVKEPPFQQLPSTEGIELEEEDDDEE